MELLQVPPRAPKPHTRSNPQEPDKDDAVVVHRARRRRKRIWQTEHDVEEQDEHERQGVDNGPEEGSHGEGAGGYVAPVCEEVGED